MRGTLGLGYLTLDVIDGVAHRDGMRSTIGQELDLRLEVRFQRTVQGRARRCLEVSNHLQVVPAAVAEGEIKKEKNGEKEERHDQPVGERGAGYLLKGGEHGHTPGVGTGHRAAGILEAQVDNRRVNLLARRKACTPVGRRGVSVEDLGGRREGKAHRTDFHGQSGVSLELGQVREERDLLLALLQGYHLSRRESQQNKQPNG